MGSRHRRMLKQFVRDGGDRKLLAWFQLPKKLFDRASRKCRDGDAACLGDEDFCDLITAIVGAIMRSAPLRSEEHTSELQSLMRISYAVFCLKKKNNSRQHICQ